MNSFLNFSKHLISRKPFRDTINALQLFLQKCIFFNQNNPWLNNIIILLNSQFTVALNGIICFPVWFYNNSLFSLKMRFQVFSFVSTKVQGFSSDKNILMSLFSVLFHLQKVSQFFEILIFSKNIFGNVHYVREINLIFKGTPIKVFYFPSKTI